VVRQMPSLSNLRRTVKYSIRRVRHRCHYSETCRIIYDLGWEVRRNGALVAWRENYCEARDAMIEFSQRYGFGYKQL
jgi:hypothetical protein